MKVLAIIGTHRKKGLVERLCQSVLNGAKDANCDIELINLYDYKIEDCIGCWYCVNKKCCINDDFSTVFSKLLESDIVVLGIPCYWSNVPGKVKTFFDRHTGYCMNKPPNADKFAYMTTKDKLKTGLSALGNFGGDEAISGKKFILISAQTFPFPVSYISGDKTGLVHAVKSYVKKLNGSLIKKIVYTDSLFKFRRNKENKYLSKTYNIGKNIMKI